MKKFTVSSLYPTLALYVAGEFLFSFMICFLFYFLIFFLNQLLLMAQEILSKGIALPSVLLLLLYSMPTIIILTIPFAVLTAALMAFGRFSSDNEILAMSSAGFQKILIFRPVLVLGALLAIVSFTANDLLHPAGTRAYQRLWLELSLTNPGLELDDYSVRNYRNSVLITGRIDDEGIRPMIIIERDNSGNRTTLISRLASAQIRGNRFTFPGFRMVDILAVTPDAQDREAWSWSTAESMEYRLLTDYSNILQQQSTAQNMRMKEIRQVIDDKNEVFNEEIALHEKKIGMTGWEIALNYASVANLNSPDWSINLNNLENLHSEITTLLNEYPKDQSLQIWKLEYYQKYSIPLSCIPFVIMAFPLGLSARRSGRAVGFFTGLILTTLYWSILIIGRSLGLRAEVSPFVVMVLPNIILFVIGIVLFTLRKQ